MLSRAARPALKAGSVVSFRYVPRSLGKRKLDSYRDLYQSCLSVGLLSPTQQTMLLFEKLKAASSPSETLRKSQRPWKSSPPPSSTELNVPWTIRETMARPQTWFSNKPRQRLPRMRARNLCLSLQALIKVYVGASTPACPRQPVEFWKRSQTPMSSLLEKKQNHNWADPAQKILFWVSLG